MCVYEVCQDSSAPWTATFKIYFASNATLVAYDIYIGEYEAV
jgi:hypothetical protein